MNLKIDELEKLITILSFFLIFCGTIKVYTYYRLFGLSITPYIKLTEVLTLFLENLFAFFIVALFVSIVSFDFFYEMNLEDGGILSISKLDVIERIILMLKKIKLSYWFLGISFLGYAILYFSRKNIKGYELFLSIPFFLIGYIIVPMLSVEIKLNLITWYKIDINIVYIFFGILLASLALFSLTMAMSEVHKVKRHNFFNKIVFVFDDSTLISNTKLYYIGRTEGFIFFFNTKNKKPIIYPASKFKKSYSKSC